MKLARSIRITISLVALFAMTWVHAFKPARGFECECGDEPAFTLHEHCHGPHSEACHDHEDEADACHDHEGLPPDDDTHHHTALVESLLALKADSSLFASIAATAPVILTVISPPQVVTTEQSAPLHIAVRFNDRRWPQILSRTIALRV